MSNNNIRMRSLWAEIPTIIRYPLVDIQSYCVLSILVGALSYVMFLGPILSMCLLAAYGFQAISRVSVGNFHNYLLEFNSIEEDLLDPLILAILAVGICYGPTIILGIYFLSPNPIYTAFSSEGGPVLRCIAIACVVWSMFYMPIALIVANESKSGMTTLNPVYGCRFIWQMGTTYWQSLLIFIIIDGMLQLFQYIIRYFYIPIVGTFAYAFIASYAFLAIGCTLGFAIYKKAPEMELE